MNPIIDLSSLYPYLFYALILVIIFCAGWVIGYIKAREWGDGRLEKSRNLQRGVLKGTISEQLAPYLPGFPADLKPSEAKFLGKPIDFIVFKGLDENKISEVVFVEVKSGRQYSNSNEDSLREAIEQKRVRYVPYHTPKI